MICEGVRAATRYIGDIQSCPWDRENLQLSQASYRTNVMVKREKTKKQGPGSGMCFLFNDYPCDIEKRGKGISPQPLTQPWGGSY
jgi:hypothetical protein